MFGDLKSRGVLGADDMLKMRVSVLAAWFALLFVGPGWVTADEAERQPITLAQLRKRPPLCGLPLETTSGRPLEGEAGAFFILAQFDQTTRKVFLDRLESFKRLSLDDWLAAFRKVGTRVDRTRLSMNFPVKMSILYRRLDLKADLNRRFVRRLKSIPKPQFQSWRRAVHHLVEPDWDDLFLGLTLAAADEFYDQADQYLAERAGKYRARLRGLKRSHLALWTKRIRVYRSILIDAALSIALNDGFFEGDRFDEKAFNDVLEKRPLPPVRR